MPFRVPIQRQAISWWLTVARDEFYRRALAEQLRMSSEADPVFFMNHVRTQANRSQDCGGRKPKIERLLTDYRDEAQDAA
jgi:elongation factor P hydroxylase